MMPDGDTTARLRKQTGGLLYVPAWSGKPGRERRDLASDLIVREAEIVGRLQIEPELRAGLEPVSEAERRIAGNARLPWIISEMRFGGTAIWRDNSVGVKLSSFNSSARVSPG